MLTSDELKWQDVAICNGGEDNSNLFFDEYESDVVIAMNTDQMCLHCPVAKQCLQSGMDNGDWGCWGGVYLVYGKPDKIRNSHKSIEDWERLEEIHGFDPRSSS